MTSSMLCGFLSRQVPAAARRFADAARQLVRRAAEEARTDDSRGDNLHGLETWLRTLGSSARGFRTK